MPIRYSSDRQAAKGYGNMVLYRMCADEPLHTDVDIITGKTWLIGRAYAASPQRGAGVADPDGEQDFFRELAMFPRWKELDSKLKQLTNANTFSAKSLPQILGIHEFLLQLICDVTRPRVAASPKGPRRHSSFASKYLHFHRPDHFPIFDGLVNTALSRKFKRRRFGKPPAGVDPRYARFCDLVLAYRETHPSIGTLRDFDQHLYDVERDHRRKR